MCNIWLWCHLLMQRGTYTLMSLTLERAFGHIFLGEEMRRLKVTQPGLALGKAGPLRPSRPPPCPWSQDPDEKCWPRSLCLAPPGLSLGLVPQPAPFPTTRVDLGAWPGWGGGAGALVTGLLGPLLAEAFRARRHVGAPRLPSCLLW